MGRFPFFRPSDNLPRAAAFLAMLSAGLVAQPANTILFEKWDGIAGTAVSALTGNANYPLNPTSRTYPSLYEIPVNAGDNYGSRTRGYVTPPTSGNYTFWISGDDNCELWLGTNDNPATARLVASVPEWTNSREWTKFTSQQSAPIALTGGVRYYIETRHKEGTGGDNLAVGWQGPGITGDAERPIPGSRLAPFVPAGGGPVLFVVGNTTLGAGDAAVLNLLQNMGHTVTIRQAAASTTADANGMNLVVISSTVISGEVNTKFRDVTVPVLTWEPALYDDMWMVGTAGGQQGTLTLTTVDIAAASHPIAAGRTGSPALFTSSQGGNAFGIIGGGGVKVAGIPGSATQSAIFAYETGVSMVGGNAPARRVGFSLSDNNYSALSADGLIMFAAAIDWAKAVVSTPTPPAITSQPVNQTVNVGQTATFSVTATGDAPLTYQWRRNGVNVGANSSSYTTPPVSAGDNGVQFSVVITNDVGTVTSANALLTVNSPPVITTQPANQSVNEGQTATFTVIATGTAPLTYQWRRNGANISGANSATYTTPPATNSDNGVQFSVVVGNLAGTVTSVNALLTVTSAPVIVTQPSSISVTLGNTAGFSVAATGSGTLTYQWRRNGVSIPGATSAAYTTPPVTGADQGAAFSVVVTNGFGSVVSANAILTVIIPPSITTQPAPQSVNLGQTATFSVVAAGTSPLSYQWRRNATNIVGATASSYTTPAAALSDNGAQFSVVVSNAGGAVLSANAVLTVVFVVDNNRKLAVSGELVDASGNPLGFPTPVTVDAVVRLFNAATAGSALYTEEFLAGAGKGIRVENGLFVARLGEGSTSQNLQQVVTDNRNLWVEITIDDGSPDVLAPRTPLSASAYALGGVPAAAPAALSGEGNPNSLGIEAAVGATYVNSSDNTTWYRLSSGWKLMD